MKTNGVVSLILKCCLFAGIALLALGLLLSEQEYGDSIMKAGALVLILSPFIGVLAAYCCLITEKDWPWVKAATALTVLIAVFLTASFLLF